MSLIAGIPGLVALIVCIKRGPSRALLDVYLPALLLLPDWYRWSITGHLSFNETAILPIAAFFIFRSWQTWKWSLADFLLGTLVSIMIVSEYINQNFAGARHVALDATLTVIFPYMVAKGLLQRERQGAEFAKRIAVLLTIVSIGAVYEFTTAINPYEKMLIGFFPEMVPQDVNFRYGLARIAGPYGSPILAGIMLAAGYRTTRWLEWSRNWPQTVPFIGIRKVRLCEFAIVAGSLMTLSRGPWVAAVIAALAVAVGRARNRRRAIAPMLVAAVLAAIPVYHAVRSYFSVSGNEATTEMQQKAIYRYELLGKYVGFVKERPTWGWGVAGFPTVAYMSSIDNQYLFLALTFGVYATATLVAIFAWMSIRLFATGVRLPRDDPAALLILTLLGVHIVFAVGLATVWLGAQTGQFLFLIAGWSEGLLQEQAHRLQQVTGDRVCSR